MIIDIFSSFDPIIFNNSLLNNLIWLSLIVAIIIIPSLFSISHKKITLTKIMRVSLTQIQQKSKTLTFSKTLLPTLFTLLIITNIIRLIPSSIPISSHLIVTITLGIPIWIISITSSFKKNAVVTMSNLVPQGSPLWLAFVLVLIELIRTLVRPITLSFRLAANITAGHIILSLISITTASSTRYLSSYTSITALIISSFYTRFEIAIATIQAFIFILLLTLYLNEHSYKDSLK